MVAIRGAAAGRPQQCDNYLVDFISPQLHGFSHIISALLRAIARGILERTSHADLATYHSGHISLRMPRVLLVLGGLLIALSIMAIYRSFPFDGLTNAGVILQVLFCLVIAVPGVVLALEGLNHKVLFDPERCYVTGPMGRMKGFGWNEVLRVTQGGTSSLMRIRLKDGRTFKLSPYLLGFQAFLNMLEERTGVRVKASANTPRLRTPIA